LYSRGNSKVEYTYGWYSASAEIKSYAKGNNKVNKVIRSEAEIHLNMTHNLLAPTF
jgi:hypothetical protein